MVCRRKTFCIGFACRDKYRAGRRYWESTSLTFPDDKVGQKEVLRLAEEIRRKRELQLVSRKYQLIDPVASKTKLIDYARRVASEYDRKAHINKSIKYLSQYAQDIVLNDVDVRFVDSYRSFLLRQHTLGERTAQHYLDAFKALLTRAERELLIERNPARVVRPIKAPEYKRPFLTID